jgi:Fur family transcriptional regulator, ferric uptake regulator
MAITRITQPLKKILKVFNDSQQALSAVDLLELLQENMNKSTVYRTLDRLEDEGILHSFLGGDGLKWYAKCKETCPGHEHKDVHPHFQCETCGKTECIQMQIELPEIPHHKVSSTHFLVFGTCEECL